MTISRTAAPDAAAPRTPRCAFHPRERRLDHRGPTAHEWSKENAAMNPLNNLPSAVSGAIPARAGFTSWPRAPRSGPADHSRSREVYRSTGEPVTITGGSSPLARGLLGRHDGVSGPARIIPARAGFTRRSPDGGFADAGSSPLARGLRGPGFRGRVDRKDHPRSRGVYRDETALVRALAGSSPLARGLRARRRDPVPGPGIIPARAGFTGPLMVRYARPGDHPRSRGVYPAD